MDYDTKILWAHKLVTANGCWEWTRSVVEPQGYGQVWHRGRRYYTHRLAWLLANGTIPPTLCVCHHCDNRKCFNPAHLFLGTQKDNMVDAVSKGRLWQQRDRARAQAHAHAHIAHLPRRTGEQSGMAKLSNRIIREIVEKYRRGVRISRLAVIYSVSESAVRFVVKGQHWQEASELSDASEVTRLGIEHVANLSAGGAA